MDKYRERKGEEGEIFVYKIIMELLTEMDYDYRVIRNAIIPFQSVYGQRGYITAEFDIMIITPFFIFLLEIKNECYKNINYTEPLWKLINDDKVSNPINQNHTHKLVFCSEFNVSRERVITIEILLENGKLGIKSPFVNDYIFSKDGLRKNLMFLLATEAKYTIDIESIYRDIKNKVKKYNLTKEDHIKMLKRTEEIEARIRNVTGTVNLRRTDIVMCCSCNSGVLSFREMSYRSTRESKRSVTHFALGCSNYNNSQINCNCGLIYVDKYKLTDVYLQIKPVHIEEKNGWGNEKMVKMVLDEINNLRSENARMAERLKQADAQAIDDKNQIQDLNNKYMSAQDERERFKKIFGSLYVYKK